MQISGIISLAARLGPARRPLSPASPGLAQPICFLISGPILACRGPPSPCRPIDDWCNVM